ncbi:uncharacterized protein C18orf19 homolog A [Aedes albopictus]|uniref:DUF1279 domain-containing protein n=1 Tax=Aedes albopictus TaxID=7160 RepID=A0ABM1Z6D1_AEDAL
MSSMVIGFTRVTLTGLGTAARSPANRFLSHLQLNGAQLRNVAVCSSSRGLHSWSRPSPIYADRSRLGCLVDLQRQQFQHQSVRCFFRDVPDRAQQIPEDKKGEPGSTASSSQSSPVDGSGSSSGMQQEEPAKLGLFARFKKMYKEYWYVLVPVHCVTSVFWLGGFYYASKSGVDVIALLESMGVSQKLIDPVRDSSLGHIAVAYLLYKIATPARYTVTLGGTTLSIKYLVQWGYIKPMPSKAKLVQMYKDKKENLQERIAEKKQDFHDRKQQLTDASKKNLEDRMKTIKPKKDVTEPK